MFMVLYISDSVNQDISTARRTRASLYDWIVYKRESKAKEKERKRQVVHLRFYMTLRYITAIYGNLPATCQLGSAKFC